MIAALMCAACASYTTPGAGVSLDVLGAADASSSMRQPVPRFPLRIAVVRVQAAQYQSASAAGYGHGLYSVLGAPDPLNDQALKAITAWPSVTEAVLLDASDLPEQLSGIDDLRLAAAKKQADLLLIYTVDTSFDIGGKAYAARASIPLGGTPDTQAAIRCKTSLLFADVPTGFAYKTVVVDSAADGLAEAWSSAEALDRKRLDAERHAMGGLLGDAGKAWSEIVRNNQ